MAEVKIADVIVPDIFSDYMVENTATKSAYFRSGIIQQSAELGSLISGGGKIYSIPFWGDLSGDDEVLTDASGLTLNSITAKQMDATLFQRGKAWGANELAGDLAGSDPMLRIADRVVEYWARKFNAMLVSQIKGVLADNVANDGGDLVNDISAPAGDLAKVSSDAIIDTIALMGDSGTEITGIAMHSKVYYRLANLNLIDFIPDSEQDIGFGTFMGLSVVVDDSMPLDAGVYTTVLFKRGAFQFAENIGNLTMVETDRTGLTGVDELITRRRGVMHPMGFDFAAGSVAGQTPTNAEFALAANWDRKYEKKNAGFVFLKTKE